MVSFLGARRNQSGDTVDTREVGIPDLSRAVLGYGRYFSEVWPAFLVCREKGALIQWLEKARRPWVTRILTITTRYAKTCSGRVRPNEGVFRRRFCGIISPLLGTALCHYPKTHLPLVPTIA